MVGLVNKFAAKIEEKKGSLTEDEVCICCVTHVVTLPIWVLFTKLINMHVLV